MTNDFWKIYVDSAGIERSRILNQGDKIFIKPKNNRINDMFCLDFSVLNNIYVDFDSS